MTDIPREEWGWSAEHHVEGCHLNADHEGECETSTRQYVCTVCYMRFTKNATKICERCYEQAQKRQKEEDRL